MDIVGMLVGLAIAAGVVTLVIVAVVVGFLVWGIRRAVYSLKGEEYKPLLGGSVKNAYEHLDPSAGTSADAIARMLRRYMRADIVGKYAHAGLTALESEKRKSASFYAVLENAFPQSSLSWGKFSIAAESAHDAILQNCATLANFVQVFDAAEYRRIERAYRNASYRKDAPLDETQIEKHRLMHANLADMDAITASNDKLLLELDKLSAELAKIDNADSTSESDRIVEEIRTLIDETKYYSH